MPNAPRLDQLSPRDLRLLRMLAASLTTLNASAPFEGAVAQLWRHPQVQSELLEVLTLLRSRVSFLDWPLGIHAPTPICAHARYTRTEILAGFGVGAGAKPPTWQTGVWWTGGDATDLFAFTFDKSVGGFSPTTRYRDYAISPERVHWESQSATAVGSATGQRYINQREAERTSCFRAPANDRSGILVPRPCDVRQSRRRSAIAFVWRLHRSLPAELYTSFAAAVA